MILPQYDGNYTCTLMCVLLKYGHLCKLLNLTFLKLVVQLEELRDAKNNEFSIKFNIILLTQMWYHSLYQTLVKD